MSKVIKPSAVFFLLCSLSGFGCGEKTFSELRGLKKEMCACETEACVKEVSAKIPQLKEPADSKERRGELLALMSQMADCANLDKSADEKTP